MMWPFGACLLLVFLLQVPDALARELCVGKKRPYVYNCAPDDIPITSLFVGFADSSAPCSTLFNGAYGLTYVVSMSASDSTPNANQGMLPEDGKLHLWLSVVSLPSYGFVYADLDISGDLPVTDYEPVAGGLHWWDSSTGGLVFAADSCRFGGMLIGNFVVNPTSVDAHSWGRIKALYR